MRKFSAGPSCFERQAEARLALQEKPIEPIRRRISRKRTTGRHSASEKLRLASWLDNALEVSQSTLSGFASKYVYEGKSCSQLARKWANGSAFPTRRSIDRIELALPGTREVFDHPLFSLLAQDALSEREIRKLLRGSIQPEDSWFGWEFPNDEYIRRTRNWRPVGLVCDTNNLVERYDLWGFTAIVATVRLAEVQGKDMLHMACCMDMYRALPAALMTPWLRNSASHLVECMTSLRYRRVVSIIHFSIDWKEILSQTNHLLASTEEQRNDPATYRHNRDVIYPAIVTPDPAIPDVRIPPAAHWADLDPTRMQLRIPSFP